MSAATREGVSARRERLLGEAPGAFAVARFVRVTPQKARRIGDLIRGLEAEEALALLKFAPQAVAENFYKLVESAVANAETTEGLDRSSLVISQVQVDEGPTMKRWRPRAKGAANRILKRSSHLTVVVQPTELIEAARLAANTKTSKKNPPRKNRVGDTPSGKA